MTLAPWLESILSQTAPPNATWTAIFEGLKELALSSPSPAQLQHETVGIDRLLAESAWDLWRAYSAEAPRTADKLRAWWSTPAPQGRAILILDALSLRELSVILAEAGKRGITHASIKVTGSEVPSDTDQFARALGVTARSSLANNKPPAGFFLKSDSLYTDVLNLPFEDCAASMPYDSDLFIWHTWLDDQIHVYKRSTDQLAKMIPQTLQGDGFWQLVQRLRQGRRLLLTADHGYAISKLFSTEVDDPALVEALRGAFGASRSVPALKPWTQAAMPPLVLTENGQHVVMGQMRWKVQGGFPELCHGGLSVLEVAVPFIEFSPL